jgi:hypothetical protein
MPPEDLLQALRKRPFEPFRIHVSDGTVYDVRHPELVMVGRRSAVIGWPDPSQAEPLYERYETVALLPITRLEPIAPPAQPISS